MTERWHCADCGAWWDMAIDRCPCHDEPPTEQDRIDAEGDRLFHELREDGEL